MVIENNCRVVAPTRRSSNSAPRRSMVAMTRLFTRVTDARRTIDARKRLLL